VVVNVDNQPILLQLCDTAGQVKKKKLKNVKFLVFLLLQLFFVIRLVFFFVINLRGGNSVREVALKIVHVNICNVRAFSPWSDRHTN
jgi:hypothetical protein